MRSSWEVAFARHCDARLIDWHHEVVTFSVGKGPWAGTTYTPDFYLPLFHLHVEIKGYLSEQNKQKLDRFQELYPEIRWTLLQSADLRSLGIDVPEYKKPDGPKKYNSGLEAMWAAREADADWGEWARGKKHSSERVEKNRVSHLGQHAWNKGIPMREESKQKLSAAKAGSPAWNKGKQMWSAEQRAMIGQKQQGRVPWNKGDHTPTGRVFSPETRQKIADSRRRTEAAKKAAKESLQNPSPVS